MKICLCVPSIGMRHNSCVGQLIVEISVMKYKVKPARSEPNFRPEYNKQYWKRSKKNDEHGDE